MGLPARYGIIKPYNVQDVYELTRKGYLHRSGVDDVYTKSLIHGDDGYSDASGKTWTSYIYGVGNGEAVPIVDADVPIGHGCLDFTSGAGHIYADQSTDFDPGSGDYTIDFWHKKFTYVTFDRCIIDRRNTSNDISGWFLYFCGGALNFLATTTAGGTWNWSAWAPSVFAANTWEHYAVVKSSNAITVYKNGVGGTPATYSGEIHAPSNVITIGGSINIGASRQCYAWLKELRFSKGIARWTSNFTPPTMPY